MKGRRAILSGVLGLVGALSAATPAIAQFTKPPSHPQPHGGEVTVGPGGTSLYISTFGRLYTFARDPATKSLRLLSDAEAGGTTVLSPDGRFAYTATPPNGYDRARIEVLSRNPATGVLTHQHTVQSNTGISALAMTSDGRHLYGMAGDGERILWFIRDPESGGLLAGGDQTFDHGYDLGLGLALAPDGRDLYVAGLNGGIHLRRDPVTGALTVAGGGAPRYSVAASESGDRVYGGGGAFRTYTRDPATGVLTPAEQQAPACGRQEGPFPCLNGTVFPSPDGQLVAGHALDEDLLRLASVTPAGVTPLSEWTDRQEGVDVLGEVQGAGAGWAPDAQAFYVFGGGRVGTWLRSDDGRGLRWAGSVPLPPPSRPPRQQAFGVAGGTVYIRSPLVTLTVPALTGATSVRISNRRDLSGVAARRFSGDGRYRWRLRPDRKRGRATVHVSYMTRPGAKASVRQVRSAVLVVDSTKPRVRRARLTTVGRAGRAKAVLLVRATDTRSGVRRVQVTTRRSRPGKARRYARRLTVRGRPRAVWVRAIDRAGNKGRWKRVERR